MNVLRRSLHNMQVYQIMENSKTQYEVFPDLDSFIT